METFELEGTEGKWHGRAAETAAEDSVPMIDAGTGKHHILRSFEFAINPETDKLLKDKKIKANPQEIFNSHWPQIKTMIWGDGLIANEDIAPKVILGRGTYKIFILCEPKLRTIVADKAKTLQEIFAKKKR